MDPKGVSIRPSPFSVKETINRLEQFLRQQGATVYARIDQQTEANILDRIYCRWNLFCLEIPKWVGPLWRRIPWPHLTSH